MTKRIFSILLCTLMLLPLAACGSGNNVTTPADTTTAAPAPSDTTQPTETTTAETTPAETTAPQTPDTSLEARDKSKTYNILMIGNSFSDICLIEIKTESKEISHGEYCILQWKDRLN